MTIEDFRKQLSAVIRHESRNQAAANGIRHDAEFGEYRLNAGRCQGLMLAADIVEQYGREPGDQQGEQQQEASNG